MHRVWSITLAHCTGADGSIIGSRFQNTDMKKSFLVSRDRAAFFLPQLKTTEERCCVFETLLFERAHRTGGRLFLWSRTIRDNHLVTRKLPGALTDHGNGYQLCAGDVRVIVSILAAHIDDHDFALL